MLRLRRLIVVLGVLLAVVPAGSFSHAQMPRQLFGLRPGLYGTTTLEKGHYQFAVNPGAHVEDVVEIYSFSDAELDLRLYPADMVQTQNGGPTAAQASDRMTGVGAWMRLDRDRIRLGPRESVRVGFTVDVPSQLSPGDYLGAVVASTTSAPREGNLAVESRIALTTRVRIPGDAVAGAQVGRLETGKRGGARTFTVDMRNTGNLMLVTSAHVDVFDGSRHVAVVPLTPQRINVIPDGKLTFTGLWTDAPMLGRRTARAVIEAAPAGGEPKQYRSDAVRMVFAGAPVFVAGGVLVAGGVGLVVRRRLGGLRPPAPAHS